MTVLPKSLRIRCLPSNREIPALEGDCLFTVLRAAQVPVGSSCGGKGICGRCALQIVDGIEHLSPESADERLVKADNEVEPEKRLSCRATLHGDVTVTADYW